MAVKVIGWVWEHSRAEGAARLTLLAIADCTNAAGNDAWPSMTELCRKTRLTERGVQKAIRRLEEMGELKVTKNAGRGRTNRYEVVMETLNVVRGSEDEKPRTLDGVVMPGNPEPGSPEPGSPPKETPNVVRVNPEPRSLNPEPGSPGTVRTVSEPTTRPPTAAHDSAQTLVAEWIEHCRKRPPSRVVGQVAKELNSLLREGVAYADVRAGLAAWHQKGLHPAALASVVHEVMNRPSSAAISRRQRETDDTFDRAMERARALDALEAGQ